MSFAAKTPRRKLPFYQHRAQENLDNIVTSLQAQLELYDKLKGIVDDIPGDLQMQKVLMQCRQEITANIRELQGSGYSIVDLVSKFSSSLFKAAIIEAEDKIAKKEQSSGEALLTDLVADDDVMKRRAFASNGPPMRLPKTDQIRQTASDIGILKDNRISQKIPIEMIKRDPRFQMVKGIIDRRRTTADVEHNRLSEETEALRLRDERFEELSKEIDDAPPSKEIEGESVFTSKQQKLIEITVAYTDELIERLQGYATGVSRTLEELKTYEERLEEAQNKVDPVLKEIQKQIDDLNIILNADWYEVSTDDQKREIKSYMDQLRSMQKDISTATSNAIDEVKPKRDDEELKRDDEELKIEVKPRSASEKSKPGESLRKESSVSEDIAIKETDEPDTETTFQTQRQLSETASRQLRFTDNKDLNNQIVSYLKSENLLLATGKSISTTKMKIGMATRAVKIAEIVLEHSDNPDEIVKTMNQVLTHSLATNNASYKKHVRSAAELQVLVSHYIESTLQEVLIAQAKKMGPQMTEVLEQLVTSKKQEKKDDATATTASTIRMINLATPVINQLRRPQ